MHLMETLAIRSRARHRKNIVAGRTFVSEGVMVVGDQSEAVEFLRNRAPNAELISTHISLIFLTGDCAFKLKRAVSYPYLDFSTSEKRLACCKAELELN